MRVNKVRESCDGIIAATLKEGEHLETREVNYAEIFGAPGYIYEYAFDIPTAVFALAFGKSGFADKLEYVTSVVLLPPDARRSVTIVWLLDEKNMLMSGYSVKNALPPVLSLDEFYQEILYESSALSSYEDLSDKNTFIAKRMDNGYSYPAVAVVNPYAEGELLRGAIEQHINVFFENPAAKLFFMGDNTVYTFVDATTVVKYFQNDVLEYSNYRAGSGETSLLKSFGAALGFIMSDPLVNNEYYLADYEEREDGYIFYFDYVINNFPVVLPDEYKRSDAAAMKHTLEVTIRDGNVADYKKLVYNFIMDEAHKTADLDFEGSLAEVSSAQEANPEKFTDIMLGYKLERSKKAYLYWIMWWPDGQSLSKIG
jgi:hypothetical protein